MGCGMARRPDLEHLRAVHHEVSNGCECPDADHPRCWYDYQDWPCAMTIVPDYADALEAELAELRIDRQALSNSLTVCESSREQLLAEKDQT